MTATRTSCWCVLSLCLGTAACSRVPAEGLCLSSALLVGNGVSLNGTDLNGVSLNGVSLNGVSLNGVSLNGVSLNGVSLNGVSLNGARLEAVLADGALLAGTYLVGLELVGLLSDGGSLRLVVRAVASHSDPELADLLLYQVEAETDAGWAPICGVGADGVALDAIPLVGRWDHREGVPGGGAWIDDPDAFTFACTGGALAKCALLAYAPWREGLREHHQSCTRLLRADYCGDGTSWTRDGIPVDVYDAVGIQLDTEDWELVTEWGPNGATCVNDPRPRIAELVPPCMEALLTGAAACGELSGGDSLLASESEAWSTMCD